MVNHSKSNRFDLQRIGPAIDIAVENCRSNYNVSLQLLGGYYPDSCSDCVSLGKAADLTQEHNITAFVGPACSDDLQVVGCFATYRHIPIVTGLGDVLKDREKFITLIRTSYDLEDKAHAILAFLEYFKWKYFGVVYRQNDVYYDTMAETLRRLASKQGFIISCEHTYIRAQNKTVETNLSNLMKKIQTCSRVVVILGGDREVRQMMLIAKDLGMSQSGKYAFIYTELFQNEAKGNQSWSRGKENRETKMQIKKAYEALFIVSIHQPYSDEYSNFSNRVKDIALNKYGFNYKEDLVNYFTASFHDAVLLLCTGIKEMLDHKMNPADGLALVSRLKNKTFEGVSGNVTINWKGDRTATNYALLDQTDQETGGFEEVLVYYGAQKKCTELKSIHWPGPLNKQPEDRPRCGFDGKDPACKGFPLIEVTLAVVLVLIIFMIVLGILAYRKVRLEAALANMSWRVRWDEIVFNKNLRSSWMMSRLSLTSAMSAQMERGWVCWTPKVTDSIFLELPGTNFDGHHPHVLTGTYKGNTVAIKSIPRQKRIELTRSVLMELKKIREALHENIATFAGACIDPPHVAILTEYCPKGSLQDVLRNDSIDLDWMFRYSLINDIVKGMCYLHNSEISSHGRLRSPNCLIDSHFVLKLSDFGIPSIRLPESYGNDPREQKKLLWKAPELLRLDICPSEGTQKGDVYSFGIILQEIVLREDPFYPHRGTTSVADILKKVRLKDGPIFRPIVNKDTCIKGLYSLMHRCWAEDPDERPNFGQIKAEMRVINRGQNGEVNIMDNLLSRMAQYTNNLEALVEQRTAAFLEEKKKSEELLYQVLPKSVAEQLKRGKAVEPEYFDSVTIYFSDIVGFTNICSSSTPMQIVDFLNDLYTCFDSVINDFDVYKVETIGDAYMVVSGLPDRNELRHAREIARMALTLLASVKTFNIRHQPNAILQLRIGIHTGPCCAGVVGQKMPRYCLFGDTVNTASRMESTGEALKIHVSHSTKTALDQVGNFVLIPREEIHVKGKGKMQTHWLLEELKGQRENKFPLDGV